MTDPLWEVLRPPPWFGVLEVLIVLGVLGFIYWAYRSGHAVLGRSGTKPRGSV